MGGQVELWLLEVERVMRASLRTVMAQAITAYSTTARAKWVLDWPGQARAMHRSGWM
jgi:dynein heavy chain